LDCACHVNSPRLALGSLRSKPGLIDEENFRDHVIKILEPKNTKNRLRVHDFSVPNEKRNKEQEFMTSGLNVI
jgi:hypothetical protein